MQQHFWITAIPNIDYVRCCYLVSIWNGIEWNGVHPALDSLSLFFFALWYFNWPINFSHTLNFAIVLDLFQFSNLGGSLVLLVGFEKSNYLSLDIKQILSFNTFNRFDIIFFKLSTVISLFTCIEKFPPVVVVTSKFIKLLLFVLFKIIISSIFFTNFLSLLIEILMKSDCVS